MKYGVTLQNIGYRYFEIEADSEPEAREKALEAAQEPEPWDITPETSVWEVEVVE